LTAISLAQKKGKLKLSSTTTRASRRYPEWSTKDSFAENEELAKRNYYKEQSKKFQRIEEEEQITDC